MPHLHLSLQSGDDLILKRMKRRHTRDDAIRFCAEMRALRPDIVFGADLIAGFPTEDEAMFARSLDIVEACGVAHLHVFPYSARPGTPAARMPQLPGPVIAERARRLREAGARAHAAYLERQVGRTQRVLTERGHVGRTKASRWSPSQAGRRPASFCGSRRRGSRREADRRVGRPVVPDPDPGPFAAAAPSGIAEHGQAPDRGPGRRGADGVDIAGSQPPLRPPQAFFITSSRSARRSTLPTLVFGSASRNTTVLGTL